MINEDYKIDFEKKRIYYNPKGSGIHYTVNELYSFLQDAFDEPDTMDDDIPIQAKSKTKYLLINGWTIDDEAMMHLKGGSLVVK